MKSRAAAINEFFEKQEELGQMPKFLKTEGAHYIKDGDKYLEIKEADGDDADFFINRELSVDQVETMMKDKEVGMEETSDDDMKDIVDMLPEMKKAYKKKK